MPKNYPAFIIDRSRRSPQSKHADDYIVCTDGELGFIAKVYKVNNPEAHNARVDAMSQEDADCTFITKTINQNLAVVVEIVKWSAPIYTDRPKLRSLLKKAMKSYLYSEIQAVAGDGSDIDKQICAVADVTRIAESQYDHLAAINGEEATKKFITHLRAAADSLEHVKLLFKNYGKREN